MAGPISGTIAAEVGDESIGDVLIGPVEGLDANSGKFSILGRVIQVQDVSNLQEGRVAAAINCGTSDAPIVIFDTEAASFVQGVTDVVLSGAVEATDHANGRFVVDGIVVDYTSLLSDVGAVPNVKVGQHVIIKGVAY